MTFLGIPQNWLNFFETFLKAPVRFMGDPNGEVRIHQYGMPIAYTLSMVLKEAMRFIMDVAVSHENEGDVSLYKHHEDLWFWHSDTEKCITVWNELNTYGNLITPEGSVCWGFLVFDATKGQFVITQKEIDKFIIELRDQLAATKSVSGWVNVYNEYMTFVFGNLGGILAVCFGPDLINDICAAVKRIQLEAFSETEGAVAELASKIKSQYGISDILEGYFYFPMSRAEKRPH
ncbi:hypothetical protein M422DRAFT_256105 [Sphaerobolus stellatus SS14]|uniref:Uncharacterized protein n=1 Tax=Sphaerobolus stellatus (strain SS14) TaxID=990650 RepID=A0A0C9VSD5_SPHS4|nr:hypothetical protein M422DRAFT_256105 [Sphaerobolus stellatus SS14]